MTRWVVVNNRINTDCVPRAVGILMLLFMVAFFFPVRVHAEWLVEDGITYYTIVTPSGCAPGETFAVAELVAGIKQLTGAAPAVVSETNAQDLCVYIGRCEANSRLASTLSMPLVEEEFLIAVRNQNLHIFGGSVGSTAYGVFEFLESLGVRWYVPGLPQMPDISDIALPAADIRIAPKCSSRDTTFHKGAHAWNMHARLNGQMAAVPVQFGGRSQRVMGEIHTFYAQVPPYPKLWDEHRDWYALKKGGNRPKPAYQHDAELCLTNPELRDYMVKRVLRDLRRKPDTEIYWISQNDSSVHSGHDGCYCSSCTAQRDKYGGVWSANIIDFVQYVARCIEREFPKVKIATLAYAYSQPAPKNMIISDRIVVMLCQSTKCQLHPIGTCEYNDEFLGAAQDWRKIASNVRVYLYGRDHGCFWAPFPSLITQCKNIRTLYDLGIRSFYVQGTGGHASGMSDLRAYVVSRMMWDPTRDYSELIRDYCDGYYGAAGRFISDYIFFYDGYINRHMSMRGSYYDTELHKVWIDDNTVVRGKELFARALDAVAGDKELTRRVEVARLPSLYASVIHGTSKMEAELDHDDMFLLPGFDGRKISEWAHEFDRIMSDNGFTKWEEHTPFVSGQNPVGVYGRLNRVHLHWLTGATDEVVVAPALGGRIISWKSAGMDGDLLSGVRGSFNNYPFCGGYEELSGFKAGSPSANAEFKVLSSAGPSSGKMGMGVTLFNGICVHRHVELDAESSGFHLKSTYRNLRKGPYTLHLRMRAFLNYAAFGKTRLHVQDDHGDWVSAHGGDMSEGSAEVFVSSTKLLTNQIKLVDQGSPLALTHTFSSNHLDKVYACYNPDLNIVSLEVWYKSITLAPNRATTFELTYTLTPQ